MKRVGVKHFRKDFAHGVAERARPRVSREKRGCESSGVSAAHGTSSMGKKVAPARSGEENRAGTARLGWGDGGFR